MRLNLNILKNCKNIAHENTIVIMDDTVFVDALNMQPEKVIVDGNQIPKGIEISCEAIVGGDASHAEISAASILAKVTRDRQMAELDQQYPLFGFAKHKGYPTKAHFEAIATHGVIDQHRRSYAPVKRALGL